MEMLMLGCLLLVLVGLGGLIYLGMLMYDRYIERTISQKYPDYVKAVGRMHRLAHECMDYRKKNVSSYEKQIERLEEKLRWLPKEERDKIVEKIEELKAKRFEYNKILDLKLEELDRARDNIDAIKAAHPWLQKHA